MYKLNPQYTHYKKYENYITKENVNQLKELCRLICADQELIEHYKEDEHLNKLKVSSEVRELLKTRYLKRLDDRLMAKIQYSKTAKDSILAVKDHEKEKQRVNVFFRVGYSNPIPLVWFFYEVRKITTISSLTENTCLLKHVMKYKILKIKRPKVMLKVKGE